MEESIEKEERLIKLRITNGTAHVEQVENFKDLGYFLDHNRTLELEEDYYAF